MVSVAQGPGQVDRAALAARIQGFGNVNPPPLPEDNASTVAKRAVGNLGDMLGEEVMLTVQDFKEKGAVGAVKDAVADAGDILIDGVSSIFGWVRGDPPEEEESAAADDAAKVLSQGPRGAAYGVSQASPTGGINAVWVMPEDADPSTMAQLMAEQRQEQQKAMPPGIQPYVAPGSRAQVPMPGMPPQAPMVLPGGQTIAPYQPSGPGVRMPPFVPNAPGAPGFQGSMPSMPAGGVSSTKTMVEQISKGQIIPGPESAKRLVSQCSATKVTPSQLGDAICERIRRLYLGLDGRLWVSPTTSPSRLGHICPNFAFEVNGASSSVADVLNNFTVRANSWKTVGRTCSTVYAGGGHWRAMARCEAQDCHGGVTASSTM